MSMCAYQDAYGNLLWFEINIFLIELLELLWCLGLEWCFPSQTLEDNGPDTPKVRLGIILQ